MTYTKTLLTVEITLKSGGTVTVADTVDDAVGSAVWGAITSGGRIMYQSAEGETTFIANDCICSAKATRTTQEVEKPEGDCKVVDPCPEEP